LPDLSVPTNPRKDEQDEEEDQDRAHNARDDGPWPERLQQVGPAQAEQKPGNKHPNDRNCNLKQRVSPRFCSLCDARCLPGTVPACPIEQQFIAGEVEGLHQG
jgi:hypothetical protein